MFRDPKLTRSQKYYVWTQEEDVYEDSPPQKICGLNKMGAWCFEHGFHLQDCWHPFLNTDSYCLQNICTSKKKWLIDYISSTLTSKCNCTVTTNFISKGSYDINHLSWPRCHFTVLIELAPHNSQMHSRPQTMCQTENFWASLSKWHIF
jgi:hypothetical protein